MCEWVDEMIILCSGMMRSASTWSYNIARQVLLCGLSGQRATVGVGYEEGERLEKAIFDASAPNVYGIFKTHSMTNRVIQLINIGAVRNIFTIRDPRDAVLSRNRFVDETIETSIARIKSSILPAKHFAKSATLFLRYDDIVNSPAAVIDAIAKHIDVELPVDVIDQLVDKNSRDNVELKVANMECDSFSIDVPTGHKVDMLTGYHENHITDGRTGGWKKSQYKKILKREMKEEVYFLGYKNEQTK